MKKTIISIIIVFTVFSGLSALEQNDGFSTGGLVRFESWQSGGAGEIGFPIYRKDGFSIRNHILFSGYGYEAGGAMVLSDKVLFGGFTDRGFRSYGFVEGGFGIFNEEAKNSWGKPFYSEFKGGGGVDLYLDEKMSFFVEMGGGFNSYGSEIVGTAILACGFRTYWY